MTHSKQCISTSTNRGDRCTMDIITNQCTSVISSLSIDDDVDETHANFLSPRDGSTIEGDSMLDDSQGTTRSKLEFHDVALSGRAKELCLLFECYKRISCKDNNKNPSEVVLITGASGTGKSKLAEALRETVTLESNGFFISGKFDRVRNEPYSALVEAFTDLCDLVAQQAKDCGRIAEELKDELSVLRKVIPNLSTIMNGVVMGDEIVIQNNGRECFTRLKLSCRKFLNTIASEEHPIVLHLDDLQWADQASIELIQSLVTDKQSKYVLIIGTQEDYDITACSTDDSVMNFLQPSDSEEGCLRCTSIKLDNFSLDQVHILVSNILEMSPSKTAKLAELVLQRTGGLPLCVVKFLEMLSDRKLLVFDPEMIEWKWLLSSIQVETSVSDNVVDVVAARIEKLSTKAQYVLRLASVQGFRFDGEVIMRLMGSKHSKTEGKGADATSTAMNQVHDAITIAKQEGLIERVHSGGFKFCHDRIHGYLYFAIPSEEVARLHLSVGRVLQEIDSGDESLIFSIADHLNHASQLLVTNENKLDHGQCNLRAADLATRKSAYRLATEYCCYGLALLDATDKWCDYYYQLSLDLHSGAADAYYGCGNIEKCDKNLEEVFQNTRCVSDTSHAFLIKVCSLGAQARLEEAIDVAYAASRALGVRIPKKPSMRNAIWRIIKTKAMLHGKTDAQLLVPREDDDRLADMYHAIRLLGFVAHYASLLMKVPHICLAITTMMQLSINGQALDPSIFSAYGTLEAAMGNISAGVRMGRLALRFQGMECRMFLSLTLSHTFLLHWRNPFYQSLEPLLHAYKEGMDIGEFDTAFMAAQSYSQLAFYSGQPLIELEERMRTYCTQMIHFNNTSQAFVALPYWQMCLNLLGQVDVPTILTGDAMDQKVLEAESCIAKVDMVPQTINMVLICLCYHFEEANSLRLLLVEAEGFNFLHVGHFLFYSSRFYVGLSYIAVYRKLVHRSYKKKALKIIKRMRKWTKDGCINTKPMLSLLEAEMSTLASPQATTADVKAAFDKAIDHASEFENAGLAALANERAAHYFAVYAPEQQEAPLYMRKALELYEYWGAAAKVAYLERTYPLLANDPALNHQGATPQEVVILRNP